MLNLDFLLWDTAHFDKSTSFPLFDFFTLKFLLSVSSIPQAILQHFFKKLIKTLDELLKLLYFQFLLTYHNILLTHCSLKQIHHDPYMSQLNP